MRQCLEPSKYCNNAWTTWREQLPVRRLQHPQAPCVNVGSAARPIYLPPEVCRIAQGQRRLKLDEKQAGEMIKVAAKKPRERAAFIQQAVTQRANFPEDPTVTAFGMRVVPKMMEVGLNST